MTNDLLGTPRLITDENRQVVSRRDMTPFGEEIAVGTGGRTLEQQYSVVDGVRPKFTGQQRDDVAQLDYFNARHYAYSAGRFMSPDIFGGKLSNPQSLNLYAYTLNNPLKWVDPSGHMVSDPEKDCKDKDGKDACTADENNHVREADGDIYTLPGGPDMVVNVSGGEGNTGPSDATPSSTGPPPLPFSWWSFLPVYGSLRDLAYNSSCGPRGGCNITRATGSFIMLAADLSPIGAGARAVNAARKDLSAKSSPKRRRPVQAV